MKSKILFLIAALTQLSLKLEAQGTSDSLETPMFKLESIGIGAGLNIFTAKYGDQANFLGDVKDASVAAILLDFDKGYTFDYEKEGNDVFSFVTPIRASFVPYSQKKNAYDHKKQIRLGISHYFTSETLFGEKTTPYNNDSIVYSKVKYEANMKFINLEVAYLYEIFNINNKFSGAVGLEASFGKSYKSSIYRRKSGIDTVSKSVSADELFLNYPKQWGSGSTYYKVNRKSLYNVELAISFECSYKMERGSLSLGTRFGHQQMFLPGKKNISGLGGLAMVSWKRNLNM